MIEYYSLPGTVMKTEERSTGARTVVQEHNNSWGGMYYMSKTDPTSRRKPIGWLYPKPYALDTYYIRKVRGEIASRHPSGTLRYQSYEGCLDSMITLSLPLPNESYNLRRAAEIQALLNLKQQKVNFGVMMAEAQRTADFVGDVAYTLGRAAKHARRGRFRDAIRTLGGDWKRVPSGWLGYQYAALPLLGDVKGSLDLLNNPLRLNEWIVTAKGVVRDTTTVETEVNSSGWTLPLGRYVTDEKTVGYFVRLDYTPGSEFVAHLNNLGLSNPFEIAWEMVPYSFVVDWMLPIGDWFSTFDAALGYRFLSGSCTERREVRTKVVPAPYRPYAGWSKVRSDFSGTGRRLRLTRSIYSSSPIPMLPRVKNPLSLGHMANGLALLATAFGRGR